MSSLTDVLYARNRDAKGIKTALEKSFLLDKRFRMTPAKSADGHIFHACNTSKGSEVALNGKDECSQSEPKPSLRSDHFVAVPVTEECMEIFERCFAGSHGEMIRPLEPGLERHQGERGYFTDAEKPDQETALKLIENDESQLSHENSWAKFVVGYGVHGCPFSSSVLGNNKRLTASSDMIRKGNTESFGRSCSKHGVKPPMTKLQLALLDVFASLREQNQNINSKAGNCVENICELSDGIQKDQFYNHLSENEAKSNYRKDESSSTLHQILEQSVRSLSVRTCPRKLEVIGDDRTIVVPHYSFCLTDRSSIISENGGTSNESHEGCSEFSNFLQKMMSAAACDSWPKEETYLIEKDEQIDILALQYVQSKIWERLAQVHASPRIVRRGDIDPCSGVRESGHRILWPLKPSDNLGQMSGDWNRGFISTHTGPGSPGWISVTENGIHQSFDITRVMFSRGNVTEKIRFGSLVRPGECVLDMYAGIGYYSLPALIHGKARHVTACEWNPYAIDALRYNLKANGVNEKVTVLEGDCRKVLGALLDDSKRNGTLHASFDRISLGLLPSSEGGWVAAVSCLRSDTGGWMHVHGNVATAEKLLWAHWVCRSLADICKQIENHNKWQAVCVNVEKVKSFAPRVEHLVADIFLGPSWPPYIPQTGTKFTTGVLDKDGKLNSTPLVTPQPSCALGKNEILCHEWLMGTE